MFPVWKTCVSKTEPNLHSEWKLMTKVHDCFRLLQIDSVNKEVRTFIIGITAENLYLIDIPVESS
jgi:hypothetical protein